jgi:hypothetical protein
MSHKVVYNACYGGFELSLKAVEWLAEHATDPELKKFMEEKFTDKCKPFIGTTLESQYNYIGAGIGSWFDDKRHHKDLIAVVETLGSDANGPCAKLVITEISGNQYRIDEYDGLEEVITPEDSDWIVISD